MNPPTQQQLRQIRAQAYDCRNLSRWLDDKSKLRPGNEDSPMSIDLQNRLRDLLDSIDDVVNMEDF